MYPTSLALQQIYFIQQGQDGPIKIGSSTQPFFRLNGLQSANPEQLHIIGIVTAAPYRCEAKLHKQFAEYRIRGEWFAPTSMLLDWIAKHCNGARLQAERAGVKLERE